MWGFSYIKIQIPIYWRHLHLLEASACACIIPETDPGVDEWLSTHHEWLVPSVEFLIVVATSGQYSI